MINAYDRAQFARAGAYSLFSLFLAFGVAALTDEAGSTAGTRIARIAAFAPAAAVLGVWVTMAKAAQRGEVRALGALGAAPLRAAWGALVAGWLLGGVALAMVLLPITDVRALFPVVTHGTEWRKEREGLAAPALGVHVEPTGRVVRTPRRTDAPPAGAPGRTAVFAIVGPLAAIGPVWGAVSLTQTARLFGLAASAAAALVFFHAIAARGVAAGYGCIAAFPLLAQGVTAILRERSRVRGK